MYIIFNFRIKLFLKLGIDRDYSNWSIVDKIAIIILDQYK